MRRIFFFVRRKYAGKSFLKWVNIFVKKWKWSTGAINDLYKKAAPCRFIVDRILYKNAVGRRKSREYFYDPERNSPLSPEWPTVCCTCIYTYVPTFSSCTEHGSNECLAFGRSFICYCLSSHDDDNDRPTEREREQKIASSYVHTHTYVHHGAVSLKTRAS